ncbi:MAG: conjugal transfer protein [Clostridia bacterium]|nr:MAG: conjugal transfer protein [Clostridia bacterium]
MYEAEWIFCPCCRAKTKTKVMENTILENFPLFCPKCKHEILICVKQFNITVIKEPDALDAEPITR